MKKLLLIPLLLLLITSCNGPYKASRGVGDKWYVSTTGSDTDGDGSLAHPWLTLKHAADTVTGAAFDNDTIIVGAGTFIETSQIALGVKINIKGAGVTSIIHSQVTASATPTIYGYSASVTDGSQSISNLKMEGDTNTAWSAIRFVGRTGIKIYDCTIEDFYCEGVAVIHPDVSSEPTAWITGTKIYNNNIKNSSLHTGTGSNATYCGLININGSDGALIYNNILLVENRTDTAEEEGECINGYRYWKRCKIYSNNMQVTVHQAAYFDMSMEMFYSMGGNEIYDNTIKGGYIDLCWNYCTSPYSYSVYIHDNFIGLDVLPAYNTMLGIDIETNSTDIIICNNHFKNLSIPIEMVVGFPTFGEATETIENIYIYYNIMENCGNAADNWGMAIACTMSTERSPSILFYDNINIWNNVIISVTTDPIYTAVLLPSFATATNFSIRNNIMQGFNTAPIWTSWAKVGATIDTVSIENNNFYGNDTNAPVYGGVTPTRVTAQNNITTAPLFKSNETFRLRPTSGAIDAGIDVNLSYDHWGHRITGTPDIGAHEYGEYLVLTPSGKPLRNANGKLMIIH